MLHDGSIKEEDKFNNGTTEGILYWYHDYAVEYLEHNGKCSRCHCNEWCTNQTECKTEIKKYRKMDLKNKNIHLELLGRVCVASESGYIANYVVEELKKLSRYSCNHMG